jgi:hypothetical protein
MRFGLNEIKQWLAGTRRGCLSPAAEVGVSKAVYGLKEPGSTNVKSHDRNQGKVRLNHSSERRIDQKFRFLERI